MKKEVTVTLTRVFPVPRERLYAAWTRAEQLKHWFGPRGFTIPSCEADPRPGGLLRLCMRSPDGKDFWVRGVFRELVAHERVLIYCVADDEDGNLSLEETIDVTLTRQGSGTRLSLRASATGSTPQALSMLKGMEPGWHQTVDRLGSHLSPPADKT